MDSNNQVSPRRDDERKHETEGMVRATPGESRSEARRQQAPGDGEPDLAAGRRPETAEPDSTGTSIDERMDRSDFATWLLPSGFPATGSELVVMATEAGAPEWVLERLGGLDADRTFDTIGEVWDATNTG